MNSYTATEKKTRRILIENIPEHKMDLIEFFEPKSIAIIGASRKEGSLGHVFLESLIKYGYTGQLYPINPNTSEINGIICFQNIEELPEIPDMAVILIRKELAVTAVEECGKKGIRNIIMITAGFREVGGEGIKREKELMKKVRKYKIRLIGPNCMGVINTDRKFRMNASFSPTEPFQGNVAFVSQSGALGVAVLEMSRAFHLGFSIFVSEGNKADLTDNDFLDFLDSHENSKVITLYLESLEHTARFRKNAATISRKKPIIALKAGRSKSGAKAASSHTGALASSDLTVEALFKQAGIIRADTIEELFEYSLAFSNQPIPKGNRVGVITNAGGPAILATDAIEKYGLQMSPLDQDTIDELKSFLPEEASIHNPVDMIASATEVSYQKTLNILLKDPSVDAILVIIVRPPVNTTPRLIAESFRQILAGKSNKPIFVILMARTDEDCGLEVFQELRLPVYSYPESAAKSLAKMLRYQEWRKLPTGKVIKFDSAKNELLHIFASAKAEKRGYLKHQDVLTILSASGFPLPASTTVQSAAEAVSFHRNLKSPVVLKIESDDIIHKSDTGGVKIGLNSTSAIEKAFDEIMQNSLKVTSGDKISGIFVQEMVKTGQEIALGMNRDPNYGPMIMFGMGGIFIEVFKDVSFRVAPVTNRDASEMIQEIRGYEILRGVRGEKGADLEYISETIQRLSQLVLEWPQITELDLNPFIVAPERKNCKIVDARIKLDPKI
jgi:acetyl coenzyme A synthetase (ADP forming)-like protein